MISNNFGNFNAAPPISFQGKLTVDKDILKNIEEFKYEETGPCRGKTDSYKINSALEVKKKFIEGLNTIINSLKAFVESKPEIDDISFEIKAKNPGWSDYSGEDAKFIKNISSITRYATLRVAANEVPINLDDLGNVTNKKDETIFNDILMDRGGHWTSPTFHEDIYNPFYHFYPLFEEICNNPTKVFEDIKANLEKLINKIEINKELSKTEQVNIDQQKKEIEQKTEIIEQVKKQIEQKIEVTEQTNKQKTGASDESKEIKNMGWWRRFKFLWTGK